MKKLILNAIFVFAGLVITRIPIEFLSGSWVSFQEFICEEFSLSGIIGNLFGTVVIIGSIHFFYKKSSKNNNESDQ